ncbi:HK97 gp10 family phage protein [Hymenobacter aerilatus]|uniref:HK97 gp10 family phage protein n=1 Tax=Hymenobacter aerilatus TaxID=2932251 RepID=A0A8T9SY66_9BACT|nr:HK97-gp10 family putative phage morphogenesis protein [Hymenobacter aerilatus]UOR05864.1 HK97 gp10 family phage protein [Hymenobacter aerilatus]
MPISGLDKLIKQLKQLESRVEVEVDKVTKETAEAIAADAKKLAPVQTGKLRDSIHVVKDGAAYEVLTDVEYAPKIELGVRGLPARPFLFPAYLLHKNKFLDNLKTAINNI